MSTKGTVQQYNSANRVNGSSGGNQVRERRYTRCTSRRMGEECGNAITWWHYTSGPDRSFEPVVCAECTAKNWQRIQRTKQRRINEH